MNTARLIAYALIAILIGLIYAQREWIKEEWAATDDDWRMVLVICGLLIGTGFAAWALYPFAGFFM